MKLYWLSFADADRPQGQQFLGVAIVEITDDEVADAALEVTLRWGPRPPEAHEIGAAVTKAHRLGINPGGEVGSVEITEQADHVPVEARHVLLSMERLRELGLA